MASTGNHIKKHQGKIALENKEIQKISKSTQEMEAFGISKNVMWNILTFYSNKLLVKANIQFLGWRRNLSSHEKGVGRGGNSKAAL